MEQQPSPRPPNTADGPRPPGGAASHALRQAVALLGQAAEACDAESDAAAAAAARVAALESELEAAGASARARRADLEAATAAARARESSLRAELAAQREHCVRLTAELTAARAQLAASGQAVSDAATTAADLFPRSAPCGAGDEGGSRAAAENVRLAAKVQSYRTVIQKQQRIIREHEARLHAYGARALSAAARGHKRRRMSCSSRGAGVPLADAGATENGDPSRAADEPVVGGDIVLVDETKPGLQNDGHRFLQTPEPAGGEACSQRVEGQEAEVVNGTGEHGHFPQVGDPEPPPPPPPPPPPFADAAPVAVPEMAPHDWNVHRTTSIATFKLSPAGEKTKGQPGQSTANVARAASAPDVMVVRARGIVAAEVAGAAVSGPPCRCVVRGKDARAALQGFDCDQCRGFYQATGGLGNGQACGQQSRPRAVTKASRHRLEHAPTTTPRGFWDLSFPHSPRS